MTRAEIDLTALPCQLVRTMKTPWEQMTKAQKASAHLREARYFARKALRISRAENVESMESCLYYAYRWGATDERCNKVRAIVK